MRISRAASQHIFRGRKSGSEVIIAEAGDQGEAAQIEFHFQTGFETVTRCSAYGTALVKDHGVAGSETDSRLEDGSAMLCGKPSGSFAKASGGKFRSKVTKVAGYHIKSLVINQFRQITRFMIRRLQPCCHSQGRYAVPGKRVRVSGCKDTVLKALEPDSDSAESSGAGAV